MSKERFEELAYNVGISLDGEKAMMSSDDYDFLYNYALQQAERVQELEGRERKLIEINQHELKYRAEVETQNIELEQQNKRYREAIDYVMTAEATQYRSLENALEDIKFVINETLESDSDE